MRFRSCCLIRQIRDRQRDCAVDSVGQFNHTRGHKIAKLGDSQKFVRPAIQGVGGINYPDLITLASKYANRGSVLAEGFPFRSDPR